MKVKLSFICVINLLLLGACFSPVFALEHTQKNGLFSLDIPEEWHWVEYPQEIGITYPDGKTIAMDIQMVPSIKMSDAGIKKALQEGIDKMIKDGIQAHNAALIDNKEINLDGVYARRLDFQTASPNSVSVTYISFFTKSYAFTITYGSEDEKMHMVMDDVLTTLKFK